MTEQTGEVRHVAIVGGGTAGWMAASALGRAFTRPSGLALKITLIESEAIGTVGVGEATIPPIRQFVQMVGLSEEDFIRSTAATAKLGIAFKDWTAPGSEYFHGFGDYGPTVAGQAWRQYLFRLKAAGRIDSLDAWSMPTAMARAGKFAPPVEDSRSVLSHYSYAYQFDAGLFARRLRTLAETLGVDTIDFVQGDILDLNDQGPFDVIVSTGVIHHMDRPEAGLQALAGVLAPTGVMRLGLYSERARALVRLAHEEIARLGLTASADDIRAFRRHVLDLPKAAPLAELAESEDFWSLSGCRDLLFHVREHRYTPPQLGELLASAGLTLIAFEAPPEAEQRFSQMFGAEADRLDLSLWDRLERDHPDLFAGMYHLWAQRIG